MKTTFKDIIASNAIMALLGVIIGGLITGFFSYKTQITVIKAQEQEFKTNYGIEQNKILRSDLKDFVDNLAIIITLHDPNRNQLDSIFAQMVSTSLRITLLEDFKIGMQSWQLTDQIRKSFELNMVNQQELAKVVADWSIAIKSEMKIIDYTIDEEAFIKDLLQLFINSNY